jgi:hypothetical protein
MDCRIIKHKAMKTYHYIVYGLLLGVQSLQSQDFGFDDDVQDVPAAPIDDWVLPSVFVGIVMAIVFTKINYRFNKN